jgi:archaellum component FlaF (FlaF/FlaG flagellin family)
MNEIKPKKMVNRNVAIALGIICVVLIGSLEYFALAYSSAQNSNDNLQNQVNSLQSQVKDLNNIIELSNSSVWADNNTVSVTGDLMFYPNGYSELVNYAGYLLVGTSSTSNDTWLSVGYSLILPKTGTYTYSENLNISSDQQWHAFPILPSSNPESDSGVNVYVGVWNQTETANVTISIIYYY